MIWAGGPSVLHRKGGRRDDLRRCGHRQGGPRHRGRRRARLRGMRAHGLQERRRGVRAVRGVAGGRRRVPRRRPGGHGGHRALLDGAVRVPRVQGVRGGGHRPAAGARGAQVQGPGRRQERPRRRRPHRRGDAHRPVRPHAARDRRRAVPEDPHALPPVAQVGARRGQGAVHVPARRVLPGVLRGLLRHVRRRRPGGALEDARCPPRSAAGGSTRRGATSPRRRAGAGAWTARPPR